MAFKINTFNQLKNADAIKFEFSAAISRIEPSWYDKLQKGEMEIIHLNNDIDILLSLYKTNNEDWIKFNDIDIFIHRVVVNDFHRYTVFSAEASNLTKQLNSALKKR